MSIIASEFLPAKNSLSWAKDAITELKGACEGFFKGDIAEIITDFDPKTGEHVQKLRMTKPLPSSLSRKATEALINTRHAFDQATFAARNLTSGRTKKTIYFPWARDPGDLKYLLEHRGIDERLWDIFLRHEPYKRSDGHPGGDDIIRSLSILANDKHTVGLAVGGHIQSTGFPSIKGGSVSSLNMMSPWWDPVKNEAELIRWVGDVQVNGDYKIGFEIVFKDAGLAHPVNAASALDAFSEKADAVIKDLEARCLDLAS